jgi:hypothetical protein
MQVIRSRDKDEEEGVFGCCECRRKTDGELYLSRYLRWNL